ncbi:hypothetical protein, partial [Pedobacter sp. UBA4863]|uniref:hypothetical protein n=1 Tax=Pedobacter sp. UBA4863 TaxID=1947060 RepID=UPI0025EAA429
MEELVEKIELLAIESVANSRYLLFSKDFPDYCLQVMCGDEEDFPQNQLILIDHAITFNSFRNFTDQELKEGIREKLINRLSKENLKKIDAIFKPDKQFYIDYYKDLFRRLNSFENTLEISEWSSFNLDFSNSNKKLIYSKIDNEIGYTDGFYAIFYNKKCLYIGIGKNVATRIKSHYKGSLGEEKEERWSDFFQRIKKEVTVYYLVKG